MTDEIEGVALTFNSYQTKAVSTLKPFEHVGIKLLYLIAKLNEEAGEVAGPIAKNVAHGKPLDPETVKLELGDCLYYLATIADHYGFTLEEVAQANNEKLFARHGTSYDATHYTGK